MKEKKLKLLHLMIKCVENDVPFNASIYNLYSGEDNERGALDHLTNINISEGTSYDRSYLYVSGADFETELERINNANN